MKQFNEFNIPFESKIPTFNTRQEYCREINKNLINNDVYCYRKHIRCRTCLFCSENLETFSKWNQIKLRENKLKRIIYEKI